jgi:hypothetical protein
MISDARLAGSKQNTANSTPAPSNANAACREGDIHPRTGELVRAKLES